MRESRAIDSPARVASDLPAAKPGLALIVEAEAGVERAKAVVEEVLAGENNVLQNRSASPSDNEVEGSSEGGVPSASPSDNEVEGSSEGGVPSASPRRWFKAAIPMITGNSTTPAMPKRMH